MFKIALRTLIALASLGCIVKGDELYPYPAAEPKDEVIGNNGEPESYPYPPAEPKNPPQPNSDDISSFPYPPAEPVLPIAINTISNTPEGPQYLDRDTEHPIRVGTIQQPQNPAKPIVPHYYYFFSVIAKPNKPQAITPINLPATSFPYSPAEPSVVSSAPLPQTPPKTIKYNYILPSESKPVITPFPSPAAESLYPYPPSEPKQPSVVSTTPLPQTFNYHYSLSSPSIEPKPVTTSFPYPAAESNNVGQSLYPSSELNFPYPPAEPSVVNSAPLPQTPPKTIKYNYILPSQSKPVITPFPSPAAESLYPYPPSEPKQPSTVSTTPLPQTFNYHYTLSSPLTEPKPVTSFPDPAAESNNVGQSLYPSSELNFPYPPAEPKEHTTNTPIVNIEDSESFPYPPPEPKEDSESYPYPPPDPIYLHSK